MTQRPLTVTYIVFYILFWPDTWQMLAGLLTAWGLTSKLAPAGAGLPAILVLYGMLAVMGYAASGIILRPLFRALQTRMLKGKRSR